MSAFESVGVHWPFGPAVAHFAATTAVHPGDSMATGSFQHHPFSERQESCSSSKKNKNKKTTLFSWANTDEGFEYCRMVFSGFGDWNLKSVTNLLIQHWLIWILTKNNSTVWISWICSPSYNLAEESQKMLNIKLMLLNLLTLNWY